MICISDKKTCCGCEACAQVCPVSCIEMQEDNEGFIYPKINEAKCIHCGKCESVCPVRNYCEPESVQKAFAVRNRDAEAVQESASGGAFSIFAQHVLAQHGVVFGAAFDKDLRVRHIAVETMEELPLLRCSKYVQSRIGTCFAEAKHFLETGRTVCFAGTPCQIYGLYLYLGKRKYHNLLTVDFACHGVPSPKIWNKYIQWLKTQGDAELLSYRFRDKQMGYQYTTFSARYKDGSEYMISDARDDRDFMKDSFFHEYASRPSCYCCAFKSVKHIADVTLFDCWHHKELTGTNDFESGATTVILHTKEAVQLWTELASQAVSCEISLEQAVDLDGVCLVYSKMPHPRRKEYFDDLDRLSVDEMQEKYFSGIKSNPLKEAVKKLLHQIGLFDFVRNQVAKRRMKKM